MENEQRSYVIFLPKSLDLEQRRAYGTAKVVHEGRHSESIEMSFPIDNETACGIEDVLRESARRPFEQLRAPRDVISSFWAGTATTHPFVPLSGSQDTGGRYTRCGVVGCTASPEGHPK